MADQNVVELGEREQEGGVQLEHERPEENGRNREQEAPGADDVEVRVEDAGMRSENESERGLDEEDERDSEGEAYCGGNERTMMAGMRRRLQELEEENRNARRINRDMKNKYMELQRLADKREDQARLDGINEGRFREDRLRTGSLPIMRPKGFVLGRDNFRGYLNTFKIFVAAAKLREHVVIDTLMTYLDERAQRRVETLRLTEVDKQDVMRCYDRIADVLSEQRSKAEYRRRLFEMRQGESETITDFASRVIETADAAYSPEEEEVKQSMMRDVFVAGVANDSIGIELVKNEVEEFEAAVQRAVKLEGIFASRDKTVRKEEALFMVEVDGEASSVAGTGSVNNIAQRSNGPAFEGCYNCGKPGHLARNCKSPPVCYQCGRSGHRVRECRAKDALTRARGGSVGQMRGRGGYRGRGNLRGSSSVPLMRCYTCDQPGHLANQCKETECYACGRKGHISTHCPNSQPGQDKVQARLKQLGEGLTEAVN